MRTFIIAEAGVNHNGSLVNAKKLVDIAQDAGADCVKFQTFIPESCVAKTAPKAQYQAENTEQDESQLEMIKKISLTFAEFVELKKYCEEKGILFLSTPFDLESIEFLDQLGLKFWKIPSGEITNLPYLLKIAQTNKPVIMSTGMSTMREIEQVIDLLKNNGTTEIKLLHCSTAYPTLFADVNLQAMLTMKKRFNLEVGYSDHTLGIEVPIAAVAMGAVIIEKHFTISRKMSGPDHKASLEPAELKQMVSSIRHIEQALGDGVKRPTKTELANKIVARKSIVAKADIKKGELLTADNLTTKRPGNGISPMEWFEVLGTVAKRTFSEDELIEL